MMCKITQVSLGSGYLCIEFRISAAQHTDKTTKKAERRFLHTIDNLVTRH
jgi:hypothetical protein